VVSVWQVQGGYKRGPRRVEHVEWEEGSMVEVRRVCVIVRGDLARPWVSLL